MATVLIVEDEFLVRDMVQTALEDAGYEVVVAASADAAIAILEARADIYLVFTDIDMSWSTSSSKQALHPSGICSKT